MKLTWLKRRIYDYYLIKGLFALVVNILLVPISLAQLADTQIAFESTRGRNWITEICLMDPDGEQIRQITDEPKYDGEPAWSPDGKRITFVSYRDLKELPEHRVMRGDIYVMNADGSNPINLTQSPERPAGVSSWSPDGKQIAFTSAELVVEDNLFHSDIWVMDADGGNPRNLTNHHAQHEAPDWSPDGLRIAFHSDRSTDWEFDILIDNWQVENWDVYVMNADGTNPINLTNHPAWDSSPSWGSVRSLNVSSNGRLVTLWGRIKRTR